MLDKALLQGTSISVIRGHMIMSEYTMPLSFKNDRPDPDYFINVDRPNPD
jgi:hypothetical protein